MVFTILKMIDATIAVEFIDLLRYLYCMGVGQFEDFARGAWPGRWDHMCNKWWEYCEHNPWLFICSLDSQSVIEMIEYYNTLSTETGLCPTMGSKS